MRNGSLKSFEPSFLGSIYSPLALGTCAELCARVDLTRGPGQGARLLRRSLCLVGIFL